MVQKNVKTVKTPKTLTEQQEKSKDSPKKKSLDELFWHYK